MNATTAERRIELVKQMREHEVAVLELSSLLTNRAMYQKHGNIFFPNSGTASKSIRANGSHRISCWTKLMGDLSRVKDWSS
ncbi:unnamed protein product [Rhodiola kirilowii]